MDDEIREARNLLHAAANTLCGPQNREADPDYANFLLLAIDKIRDIADAIDPPGEEWPTNVIPWRPRGTA